MVYFCGAKIRIFYEYSKKLLVNNAQKDESCAINPF